MYLDLKDRIIHFLAIFIIPVGSIATLPAATRPAAVRKLQ